MPRRAAPYLWGAALGVLLLFATWFAAFHVALLARADRAIFRGFADLGRHPHVSTLANFIADLCNPNPWVFFAAVPVLVALVRRRPRLALTIAAILLGANVTTQLLKPLLAHARPLPPPDGFAPLGSASWPSGHATAAMSLALSFVLAVPMRLRPWVAAVGAGFAVAVSYSFLSLTWHYPSDVIGGFLVAGTWTMVAISALVASDRSPARRSGTMSARYALTPPALTLVGAGGLALLVALARPHAVTVYARTHAAFMIGAGVIGALALALATGFVLALRQR